MQVVQFGSAPAELARVRCCMLASKLQKAIKPFILGLSLITYNLNSLNSFGFMQPQRLCRASQSCVFYRAMDAWLLAVRWEVGRSISGVFSNLVDEFINMCIKSS